MLQVRKRGVPMLDVLVRLHHREGLPEAPQGSRQGRGTGDQSQLSGLRG